MEVKHIVTSIGNQPVRIEYLEKDFAKEFGNFFAKRNVPLSDIKFLVSVEEIDGKKYPVVDVHAPEDYKVGAVTHEYLCVINQSRDKEYRIRSGKNRCADVERIVLEGMQGDKKLIFTKQRKTMFQTVLKYGLNDDETALARMRVALNMLNYQ